MGSNLLGRLIVAISLLVVVDGYSQRFLTPVFTEVDQTLDLSYGAAVNYLGEEEDLLLDFYEPAADTLDYRPLIIYIHGGGFIDTNQSKSLIHIAAYCDSMASRGYIAASINYRLDSTISNRAVINAMHDAKAAVRFFKANYELYGVDTSRIFMAGESAGAITAMTTSYIDEASETSYPITLPSALDLSLEGISGNPGYSSDTKATMCFCGGTETAAEEALFDTLAIQSAANNPLLIVHGTADPFISITSALNLAIRAEHIELPYLFHSMPGATHCPWFFPLENSWEYLDTLIAYSVPFLYACVEAPLSINEDDVLEDNIVVYPNPSSTEVRVSSAALTEQRIVISNAIGELIYQGTFSKTFSLNIDGYQAGIYFISLPESGTTHKFIKN